MADHRTATERGYGAKWQRRRKAFLTDNPFCSLCPEPSAVADHWPISRKDLLSQGISNPDKPEYLRPLCVSCHNRETNKRERWRHLQLRKRPKEDHPGLLS